MSAPVWAREGADWPHRSASSFVSAAGLRWHVQRMGAGPPLLLLHGTGAATHSWRDLMPLLAARHEVIACDLPGHGFTSRRQGGRAALPWMARAVGDLLATLGVAPALIVGHSAGAAVAVRMVLDGRVAPVPIVALSGALLPFPGPMHAWAGGIARLLFVNPLVPRLLSWHGASTGAARRMIAGTGSVIDARGMALYERLFACSGHIEGALAMMADWDLVALERDLPRLAVPLTLVAPAGDRFVAPDVAARVARLVPQATVVPVERLGHLAHEEDAAQVAAIVERAFSAAAAGG